MYASWISSLLILPLIRRRCSMPQPDYSNHIRQTPQLQTLSPTPNIHFTVSPQPKSLLKADALFLIDDPTDLDCAYIPISPSHSCIYSPSTPHPPAEPIYIPWELTQYALYIRRRPSSFVHPKEPVLPYPQVQICFCTTSPNSNFNFRTTTHGGEQ